MKKQDVIVINGRTFKVIAVSEEGRVDKGNEMNEYRINSSHRLIKNGEKNTFTGGVVAALGEVEGLDARLEVFEKYFERTRFKKTMRKHGILCPSGIIEKFMNLFGFFKKKAEESRDCFEYKEVLELVFEAGKVTAMVDHSRDMMRVRRNLEYGLRDLHNFHDRKSIRFFINHVMVCDYGEKWINKRS